MKHDLATACLSAAVLIGVGCGGGGGDGCANIAGNWSGQVQDSVCGAGTLNASFQQSGCSFSGTIGIDFSGSSCDNSGSVTGDVDGDSVSGIFSSSIPGACPFSFTGSVVSPSEIAGTYASFNCSEAVSGTFDIFRE